MKGKEGGKDVTHKIEFDSSMMGQNLTKEKANDLEWDMFYKAGGLNSKQRHWKINPYKFARTQFSVYIDPDVVIAKSMGIDVLRRDRMVQMLTNPAILPYINMRDVIKDFIVKDYADADPDKYMKSEEDMQKEQAQNPQGIQGSGQTSPNNFINSAMGGVLQ
jgi:hypothetical protein